MGLSGRIPNRIRSGTVPDRATPPDLKYLSRNGLTSQNSFRDVPDKIISTMGFCVDTNPWG